MTIATTTTNFYKYIFIIYQTTSLHLDNVHILSFLAVSNFPPLPRSLHLEKIEM